MKIGEKAIAETTATDPKAGHVVGSRQAWIDCYHITILCCAASQTGLVPETIRHAADGTEIRHKFYTIFGCVD
jgi:hypothetical protein